MKHLRSMMLFCCGVVAVSEPLFGQCDKTFSPGKYCGYHGSTCTTSSDCAAGVSCVYIDDWDNDAAWDPTGRPGSTQAACIPAGKEAWLYYAGTHEVGRVIVSSDATNGNGEIYIANGSTLKINGTGSSSTSTIDGEIEMLAPGTRLIFSADHTFSGTGEIVGNTHYVVIDNSSATVRTLTIGSGVTFGGALEAKVAIANNGTVLAENGTVKLTGGGSGSGVWEAKGATGQLQVLGAVTGSGTWKLIDNAGAKIVIDALCNCLTGNVEMSTGTLDVNQSFETEGQLSLGGKDSLIDVASGKTARFSTLTSCSY